MSELTPALATALAQPRVLVFGAVKIVLPSKTLRLLDGSGALAISGESYSGSDPDWGVLDTIKGLSDSSTDSAPAISIGLIPPDTLALSDMLDPALQGCPVTVMIGAADPATGAVIDVYQWFALEWDVATPSWGANDRRVEVKCTSVAEAMFTVEEGRRLSDAFHQSVWPGELGMAFVTGVEQWVPWGQTLDTNQLQIRTDQSASYTSIGATLAGGAFYAGAGAYGWL
jgi:hypothetical protein